MKINSTKKKMRKHALLWLHKGRGQNVLHSGHKSRQGQIKTSCMMRGAGSLTYNNSGKGPESFLPSTDHMTHARMLQKMSQH